MIEYEEFLKLVGLLKKLDIDARAELAKDRDHMVPFRMPDGNIGRIRYVPADKEVRLTTVGNRFERYSNFRDAANALVDAFGADGSKFAGFMESVCKIFNCSEAFPVLIEGFIAYRNWSNKSIQG
jgi:hypothetical protein